MTSARFAKGNLTGARSLTCNDKNTYIPTIGERQLGLSKHPPVLIILYSMVIYYLMGMSPRTNRYNLVRPSFLVSVSPNSSVSL